MLAFTRITMLGLIRLLTNRQVIGGSPFSPQQAWTAYGAFLDLPEVSFLSEPDAAEATMRKWSDGSAFPASRFTDAWIAAVAVLTRSQLVSFGADYRGFAGLSYISPETQSYFSTAKIIAPSSSAAPPRRAGQYCRALPSPFTASTMTDQMVRDA